MAATDKDVFQKTKAIRFCLATGLIPFYEVNVCNIREFADKPELLTDIDVFGVSLDRHGVSRIIFDCKTTNKASPINRAFWAKGLMNYVNAESAYVILKKSASEGHKLTAKSLQVHLFDESLFESYAAALSSSYIDKNAYAVNIDNWHSLHETLRVNSKINKFGEYLRHTVPLEPDSAKTLRGIIAHLKQVKGELDPAKKEHMAIFCYTLFSLTFCISPIVRDFFDIFDPKESKVTFEKFLRTYIWGGREAYLLRKKLRDIMASQNEHITNEVELDGWEDFVEMIRTFLDAPDEVNNCCNPLLHLTFRFLATQAELSDQLLTQSLTKSNRIRQFTFRLSKYLTTSAGLPKEFDEFFRNTVNELMNKTAP